MPFDPNSYSGPSPEYQGQNPSAPPPSDFDPKTYSGPSVVQAQPQGPWWEPHAKAVGSGILREVAPTDVSRTPKMFGSQTLGNIMYKNPLEYIPGVTNLEHGMYEGGQYNPPTYGGKAEKIGARIATNLIPALVAGGATSGAISGASAPAGSLAARAATYLGENYPRLAPYLASTIENALPGVVSGSIAGHEHPGRGALVGGLTGGLVPPVTSAVSRVASAHPIYTGYAIGSGLGLGELGREHGVHLGHLLGYAAGLMLPSILGTISPSLLSALAAEAASSMDTSRLGGTVASDAAQTVGQ